MAIYSKCGGGKKSGSKKGGKKADAKVAKKNLAKIDKKYVHFVFEVDIYNSIKLKSYSVSLVN
jgi:hypothetical protein